MTARPGRLAEVGFAVGGEQRLISLGNDQEIANPDLPFEPRKEGLKQIRLTDYDSLEKCNFIELSGLSMCQMCAKNSIFWPKKPSTALSRHFWELLGMHGHRREQ